MGGGAGAEGAVGVAIDDGDAADVVLAHDFAGGGDGGGGMSLRAVGMVGGGGRVIGSTMTPFSERFTFSTSRAWLVTERFLWMMPMPPSCASAIARADSVTVSMGAETRGMLSSM